MPASLLSASSGCWPCSSFSCFSSIWPSSPRPSLHTSWCACAWFLGLKFFVLSLNGVILACAAAQGSETSLRRLCGHSGRLLGTLQDSWTMRSCTTSTSCYDSQTRLRRRLSAASNRPTACMPKERKPPRLWCAALRGHAESAWAPSLGHTQSAVWQRSLPPEWPREVLQILHSRCPLRPWERGAARFSSVRALPQERKKK